VEVARLFPKDHRLKSIKASSYKKENKTVARK